MIEEHLARRLLRAGESRAHHGHLGAGGQRLGEVSRVLDAAVGDHRRLTPLGRAGGFGDGGQLRHAHARHDAGGADGARADAHLDGVRPDVDQSPGAVIGGDVAGDDLHAVGLALDPLNRAGDVDGMAVGGVDHHHIDPGLDQSHGAFVAGVAHGGGGAHAQAALLVLGREGIGLGLVDVLHGDEPGGATVIVHHDQPLDLATLQDGAGLFLRNALPHHGQGIAGHQLGGGGGGIFRKAHVAVGEDADQLARAALHHREA